MPRRRREENSLNRQEMAARSAYVHIPFCRQKCHYCDFAVHAIGSHAAAAGTSALMAGYVEALVREIRATAQLTGGHGQGSRHHAGGGGGGGGLTRRAPLQTVYIGGGTPSLLPASLLGRVLAEVDGCFGIAPDAEVTVEADPATFTACNLAELHAVGVNRLSVGAQAFQDKLLLAAGRTHSVDDTHAAIAAIAASPFAANWSLDLLFGLPEQTAGDWAESIALAVDAAPQHIATYGLTVEPSSAWGLRGYEENVSPLPRDGQVAKMFEAVHHTLTAAGYGHYEVSNFAKPGCESRHNKVYWEGRPFYGFGVGATSCDERLRVRRPRSIRSWQRWVDQLEARLDSTLAAATAGAAAAVSVGRSEPASSSDQMSSVKLGPELESVGVADGPGDLGGGGEAEASHPIDAVIGGLRTANGVSLQSLRDAAAGAAFAAGSTTGARSEGGAAQAATSGHGLGAEALERLWPLLLALQDQRLLELQVYQQEEHAAAVGDRPTRSADGCEHEPSMRGGSAWAGAVQGRVRLTAPAGFLLADGITAEIWGILDRDGHGADAAAGG